MSKTNLNNKLTSFNKRITSNKTKHLEFQKKLYILITKYNFFLGRIYFTSNDWCQNTFFYQPRLDALEFKKYKSFDNNFVRNVKVLDADNSSSSDSDNCRNNFLILG